MQGLRRRLLYVVLYEGLAIAVTAWAIRVLGGHSAAESSSHMSKSPGFRRACARSSEARPGKRRNAASSVSSSQHLAMLRSVARDSPYDRRIVRGRN